MKTIELTDRGACILLTMTHREKREMIDLLIDTTNDFGRAALCEGIAECNVLIAKLSGKPEGAAADMERESGA